jgi:hypothetical protein
LHRHAAARAGVAVAGNYNRLSSSSFHLAAHPIFHRLRVGPMDCCWDYAFPCSGGARLPNWQAQPLNFQV